MPIDTLLALTVILAAATWTPGPNNAMLAASGATFGFRRTLPHMQGVAWGFPLMLFAVALGLGELFRLYPSLHEVLRWGGAALLLWVAFRIATAADASGAAARARPFTFWQAAGFQWINPKAWVMCAGVVAQFVSGANTVRDAAICAAVAGVVGLSSATGWAAFGAALASWLQAPRRLQLFNAAMAGTIVLGVLWLILADF
jgi:threonine/homoserine/homoserine lactone efflux protein